MTRARFLLCVLLVSAALRPAAAAQPAAPPGAAQPPADQAEVPSFDALVEALEQGLLAGNPAAYLALVAPSANREYAAAFAETHFTPGATRIVVRLRDQARLRRTAAGGEYRLILELFVQSERRARVGTWRLVVRSDQSREHGWHIVEQEQLSSFEGLHRLILDETRQYAADDLSMEAEDLTLTLENGSVFFARVEEGVTALVLTGRGRMRFSPRPPAERQQVRILGGQETLDTSFDRALVRINPFQFDQRVTEGALREQPVDPGELRRARQTFDEFAGLSYSIQLDDLSPEPWSLLPGVGDFLAEIDTRRFGILTYARARSEAEDVTLFNRKDKRNIALYASEEKLAQRGLYYDENALVDYDVLHYSIDAAFQPARDEIEGRARLTLRIRSPAVSTVILKLAAELRVRAVRSDEFGRLLHFRVLGQQNLVVGLPALLTDGDTTTIEIAYGGRLPPQPLEREALVLDDGQPGLSQLYRIITPEPRHIYSNRSYWYPQSTVTDYATGLLRVSAPEPYTIVASGRPASGSPAIVEREDGTTMQQWVFVIRQPARYLSCIVSRLAYTQVERIPLFEEPGSPEPARTPGEQQAAPNELVAGVVYDSMRLAVAANPRQIGRSTKLAGRAADIIRFYTAILGDYPYPNFTLAVTDAETPGGHSPPYFAILNQPLPRQSFSWRRDPVSFDGFDSFYLAHELAHQWWGQAVGWKNYHEQWLSEGFAQYFAALYGLHERGADLFAAVLRQMRQTTLDNADQGPIYLGYRLGHIRQESRVFRALLYNKSALVLHMLRRLVGDEAFFAGLRRFYADWRFRKAGTSDVQHAFEQASGRSLTRFFQRWIHDSAIPRLAFSYRIVRGGPPSTDGDETQGAYVRLRFEQSGEIFEVPVTVSLFYRSGEAQHVVVPVTDRISEMRVPLLGDLMQVDVNRDHAALAEFSR